MATHNFRSYSLQDTEKATNKRPFHESDYHSDLAESRLISPDASIQHITKDFDEFIESKLSRKIDLQKEGGARTALEMDANAVKKNRSQLEDYLKKAQKEKEALPKALTLNQEQAQTFGQQEKIEHMKAERADSRSGEDHQHHEDQQQHQEDREACSRLEEQVKKEEVCFLPVNNKLERLKKAPADREALIYEKETLSLQNNDITGKLEAMDAKCKETVSQKDNIIFKNQAIIVELGHPVVELTAHRANSVRKNAQIEEALNQQQKDADKLENLTNINHQLASKNKRLQDELEDALREMQLAGDAAISEQLVNRDKLDSLTRENQRVASVNKKLQSELVYAARERYVADISKQRKLDNLTKENHHLVSKSKSVQDELEDALSDITFAREAAIVEQQDYSAKLDNVKMENIQVVSENKRLQVELEDAVQQHQEDREACSRLEEQMKKEKARFLQLSKKLERLKRGPADRESLMHDKKTLSLQNNLITGKLEVMETKYKETMLQKDDIIFKNQATIVENQQLASENKRLQGELEDAVQQHQEDREACSRLEERLKKEKARFLKLNKNVERLKRGPADREALIYDKETLCLQNNNITGKLEAMEAKYKETMSQKDDIIFKNQATIVENQQLASENKRLQGELEDAVQQHQEDREACSRLEERLKKEKARFLKLNKNVERLKRGPADREALIYDKETLCLQNNNITGKLEAMEAKYKETMSQKDDIIFKNQATIVENQQLASENKRLQGELEEQAMKEKARFLQLNKKLERLKRGPADRESLMYDKETLSLQNNDIIGKLEAMEAKYDLLVQRDRAHSLRNEEVLAQKDDVLLKNQAFKLEYVVDELRTQQSESKIKQAQLEDTLLKEQIQRAVLEERISNTASTLEKQQKKTVHLAYALKTERAKSKRYSFELTEAKINQVKLQEQQHSSPSLHNL